MGLFEEFFGNGSRYGLEIVYQREERPLGTIGPLGRIRRPKEPFFVINGDILTTLNFRELAAHHYREGPAVTLVVQQQRRPLKFGVVEVNDDLTLSSYIEKPDHEYLASIGAYVFAPGIADRIQADEYMDFPDLVEKLLCDREKLSALLFDGYWKDVGEPKDYEQAKADFKRLKDQFIRT